MILKPPPKQKIENNVRPVPKALEATLLAAFKAIWPDPPKEPDDASA